MEVSVDDTGRLSSCTSHITFRRGRTVVMRLDYAAARAPGEGAVPVKAQAPTSTMAKFSS